MNQKLVPAHSNSPLQKTQARWIKEYKEAVQKRYNDPDSQDHVTVKIELLPRRCSPRNYKKVEADTEEEALEKFGNTDQSYLDENLTTTWDKDTGLPVVHMVRNEDGTVTSI